LAFADGASYKTAGASATTRYSEARTGNAAAAAMNAVIDRSALMDSGLVNS
jgi:hypothetical protein